MHLLFSIFMIFFITGCIQNPEVPSSKEALAKEKIELNKTEAQQAQDNYIKLQRQRKQNNAIGH